MPVTVAPDSFQFVNYNQSQILGIAEEAAHDAGLDGARIHVEVVESSPLGRVTVSDSDLSPPGRATFRIEGGAFENLKSPRNFDERRARETLGRLFLRLADQIDPAFGFEGDAESLSVPRQVAWDTYAIGRLKVLGYEVSHDRWQYLFRNRHGFTDEADGVFNELWDGTARTWPEISAMSQGLKSDADIASARTVRTR